MKKAITKSNLVKSEMSLNQQNVNLNLERKCLENSTYVENDTNYFQNRIFLGTGQVSPQMMDQDPIKEETKESTTENHIQAK